MKSVFATLVLCAALLLGGCGGEETAEGGVPAPEPGAEVPTQTTTEIIPLPAEGVTDTAAAPAGTTRGPGDTSTAAASPAPSPGG